MAAKDEVIPEETQPAWPDHFRYIDEISPDGVTIVCKRYVVLRESDHFYWIAPYRRILLACAKRAFLQSHEKIKSKAQT